MKKRLFYNILSTLLARNNLHLAMGQGVEYRVAVVEQSLSSEQRQHQSQRQRLRGLRKLPTTTSSLPQKNENRRDVGDGNVDENEVDDNDNNQHDVEFRVCRCDIDNNCDESSTFQESSSLRLCLFAQKDNIIDSIETLSLEMKNENRQMDDNSSTDIDSTAIFWEEIIFNNSPHRNGVKMTCTENRKTCVVVSAPTSPISSYLDDESSSKTSKAGEDGRASAYALYVWGAVKLQPTAEIDFKLCLNVGQDDTSMSLSSSSPTHKQSSSDEETPSSSMADRDTEGQQNHAATTPSVASIATLRREQRWIVAILIVVSSMLIIILAVCIALFLSSSAVCSSRSKNNGKKSGVKRDIRFQMN